MADAPADQALCVDLDVILGRRGTPRRGNEPPIMDPTKRKSETGIPEGHPPPSAPLRTDEPTPEEIRETVMAMIVPTSASWKRYTAVETLWFGTRHGTEYRLVVCDLNHISGGPYPSTEIPTWEVQVEANVHDDARAVSDVLVMGEEYIERTYVEAYPEGPESHTPEEASELLLAWLGRYSKVDAVTPSLFREVLIRRVGCEPEGELLRRVNAATWEYCKRLIEPYVRHLKRTDTDEYQRQHIEVCMIVDSIGPHELWERMPETERLAPSEGENYRAYTLRLCHLVDWLTLIPNAVDCYSLGKAAACYETVTRDYPHLTRYLLSQCVKAVRIILEATRSGVHDRYTFHHGTGLFIELEELVEDTYGV